MFRKALVLLLVAGLMAGLIAGASALFTSSATVTANTFSTGTVVITASPTSALVTFDNMAPGDEVTAPLTVRNDGSLQLRYAMTTSASDTDGKGLASQLVLKVKSGVTTCTKAGFGGSGTSVYNGSLTSGFIGDPAPGSQGGDRTLNAGTNEVLCFDVSLPSTADNTYQSATTTAEFTFDAEQTTNN